MTVQVITRRATATLQPSTLDMDAGTVDVTLSTGHPVQRRGFIERLSMEPGAASFPDRLPLLDGHRQGSIRDIMGQVRNIRREGGAIVATLHVSNGDALAAIQRGDITGVSVGYRVTKWSEGRDAGTGQRQRTATAWEIVEGSLVPVPADPHALIRNSTMEDEIEVVEATAEEQRAQTRAEIRTICRSANMTTEQADALIDREVTAEQARAAAFEHMQTRGVRITVGTPRQPENDTDARIEALACRALGTAPSEAARPFMAVDLLAHAGAILTRSGVAHVDRMGREEIATRAMATTSDFPNLLNGVGNRVLQSSYQAAASPIRQLFVQRNLPDFRKGSTLRVGGIPTLGKVTEAGEIKHVSTGEAAESFKLDTYASIFGLSRQAIINDDLGAFTQWGQVAGRASAETEANLMIALIASNPAMEDGRPLFDATHGNLAAVGAAPSIDTLSSARLALRRQTGLDSVTPINATPKYLVVAADLETSAEALLTTLQATNVADVNPFPGRLTLLVEPRLPDGEWFIAADPAALPTLAYGYLSSAPGPQLSSRDGWDVLGREFRVVLDFGVGAIDWRGLYRNPGAEL